MYNAMDKNSRLRNMLLQLINYFGHNSKLIAYGNAHTLRSFTLTYFRNDDRIAVLKQTSRCLDHFSWREALHVTYGGRGIPAPQLMHSQQNERQPASLRFLLKSIHQDDCYQLANTTNTLDSQLLVWFVSYSVHWALVAHIGLFAGFPLRLLASGSHFQWMRAAAEWTQPAEACEKIAGSHLQWMRAAVECIHLAEPLATYSHCRACELWTVNWTCLICDLARNFRLCGGRDHEALRGLVWH
jgi:hypothetical protein